MKFFSDDQRKAVFSRLNKFSMYVRGSGGQVIYDPRGDLMNVSWIAETAPRFSKVVFDEKTGKFVDVVPVSGISLGSYCDDRKCKPKIDGDKKVYTNFSMLSDSMSFYGDEYNYSKKPTVGLQPGNVCQTSVNDFIEAEPYDVNLVPDSVLNKLGVTREELKKDAKKFGFEIRPKSFSRDSEELQEFGRFKGIRNNMMIYERDGKEYGITPGKKVVDLSYLH